MKTHERDNRLAQPNSVDQAPKQPADVRQARHSAIDNAGSTVPGLQHLQDLANRSPGAMQLKSQAESIGASAPATRLRALQQAADNSPQVKQLKPQVKPNHTGLPDRLKSGIESLSGMGMDHVRVHYNSARPAQLQAHAYAQGSDIHVAPGQERHLAHEAWHVVQQMRGQVKPTMQMKSGIAVNDERHLEREADVMGYRAIQLGNQQAGSGAARQRKGIRFGDHARMPVQGLFIFPKIDENNFQSEFHQTSFLTRVNLVPTANSPSGEYAASDVWVRQVKVSDDRPPTKFGKEGQRSHTVAWTLLRAALQKLNGQPLDNLLKIIAGMEQHSDLPSNEEKAKAAADVLRKQLQQGQGKMAEAGRAVSISDWQQETSDLLTTFVHFYQLSEAATYADGQAVGHGESSNMGVLQALEFALKFGEQSDEKVKQGVAAAVAMFDAKGRLGWKILAQVASHLLHNLHLAFPSFMRRYQVKVEDGFIGKLGINAQGIAEMKTAFGGDFSAVSEHVKQKGIGDDVASSQDTFHFAIPAAHQSTFVANVMLKGAGGAKGQLGLSKWSKGGTRDGVIAVDFYSFDQIRIEQVKVADDRPNTRFGNLQRSHTVAWTMVRRHLMGFAGQTLDKLFSFMLHELSVLKDDIDSPAQNSHIKFDAAGHASTLRATLGSVITGKQREPIHQWQSAVSDMVETYVTLYQLSRSATYAKEERPKSHGEAQAAASLAEANVFLANTADKATKDAYIEEHGDRLAKQAAVMVDAVVANGNLQPAQWQIAIQHWLNIVKQTYTELGKYPDFMDALTDHISVAEPEQATLVGYAPGNDREKLLINLYESARFELKAFPNAFEKDLKTCVRLSFSAGSYVPVDYDAWNKTINAISIPMQFKRRWSKILASYMGHAQRGAVKKIPTAKHVANDTPSIEKLVFDARAYLAKVKDEGTALSEAVAKKFVEKSAGTANRDYANTRHVAIQESIKAGIDEAINLSALAEVDNYRKWFDVVDAAEKVINYQGILKAINAGNGH